MKKPEMLEFEYARSALKNGLKMEAELGVNPYKFGVVGSTDAHTALATADDDNFFGKASSSEPSATRATHPFVKTEKATIMGWEQTASGYAAVWATENTREALFDAMKRRETYATTGPRMIVRFFGGWDFEPNDAQESHAGKNWLHQRRADGRRSSALLPPANRQRSSLLRLRIQSEQTSTASKSSKAGLIRRARLRRKFTT